VDWSRWLFDSWGGLVRTALVGVLAYAALILLLRISGKRTLSKMNAFDLVVTVALGSTLATILLSPDTALAEGVVALATLIGLQYLIAWLAVRSSSVGRLIKAEPTLLLYRGEYLHAAMRRERVTEGEVLAAVRAQGIATPDEVEAVVLETDGSFTCVRRPDEDSAAVLDGVRGAERVAAITRPR
jgi:uncharacterized membrane protein YcaP (DUF421 family)